MGALGQRHGGAGLAGGMSEDDEKAGWLEFVLVWLFALCGSWALMYLALRVVQMLWEMFRGYRT